MDWLVASSLFIFFAHFSCRSLATQPGRHISFSRWRVTHFINYGSCCASIVRVIISAATVRRHYTHVIINSRIQQCVRGCYSFIFMGLFYQWSILGYLTAFGDADACGYHLIVIPDTQWNCLYLSCVFSCALIWANAKSFYCVDRNLTR